ncbi:Cyanovirin-N [Xylariales sp. AK1849]|nr:Cyanovirin-N [Xylariales sp. AK1849]
MKYTHLTTTLVLALATAQGFYDECAPTWSLGYHNNAHFLVAQCPGSDGANHTSALDLNDCLANSEGSLRAQMVGFAFNTCNTCTSSATSADIACQCRLTSGKYQTATLDLNTVVSNNDGIVECFEFPGIEVAPEEP